MMNDMKEVSQAIKDRRNKLAVKEDYMTLLAKTLMILILGYLIFTQVFLLARAEGNEMFPAVKDGDLVIVFRLQKDYRKNDLVTYQINGERKIGRYIGQGGDTINIEDNGSLKLNGVGQSGEIMYPTYPKEGIDYPYKVPEDHVFVLGDYRTQARDSRDFGPISKTMIEGKLITLLRRRGL